jgi:hypothetical protein
LGALNEKNNRTKSKLVINGSVFVVASPATTFLLLLCEVTSCWEFKNAYKFP